MIRAHPTLVSFRAAVFAAFFPTPKAARGSYSELDFGGP
jgi:hypothetical protein